jgi:hypothetical protein
MVRGLSIALQMFLCERTTSLTFQLGFSVSRLATTDPADPLPNIIKCYNLSFFQINVMCTQYSISSYPQVIARNFLWYSANLKAVVGIVTRCQNGVTIRVFTEVTFSNSAEEFYAEVTFIPRNFQPLILRNSAEFRFFFV